MIHKPSQGVVTLVYEQSLGYWSAVLAKNLPVEFSSQGAVAEGLLPSGTKAIISKPAYSP